MVASSGRAFMLRASDADTVKEHLVIIKKAIEGKSFTYTSVLHVHMLYTITYMYSACIYVHISAHVYMYIYQIINALRTVNDIIT